MAHQPDGPVKYVVAPSDICVLSVGQDMKLCRYLLGRLARGVDAAGYIIGPSEARMQDTYS